MLFIQSNHMTVSISIIPNRTRQKQLFYKGFLAIRPAFGSTRKLLFWERLAATLESNSRWISIS